MTFRYVPLLRSRAGEAAALSNLSAKDKGRLFPVVHIPAKPAARFLKLITQKWTGYPMALDGHFNLGVTGTPKDFTAMYAALGKAGIKLIPSVEYDAPVPYLNAVAPLVNRFAPGVVIKTSIANLANVVAWVNAQKWQPKDVDLIVDAGQVASFEVPQFSDYLKHVLSSAIPATAPWRTVTLALSAAPKDYSRFTVGRSVVPRRDWKIWQAVAPHVPFQVDYGDYATLTPDLTDPPGYIMPKASVSTRYTTDDEWIILKGYSQTGSKGKKMHPQFLGHAKSLVAEPKFGGLANCWGDDRIQQIVGGKTTPGDRTVWAGIHISRHLSLVADRLP